LWKFNGKTFEIILILCEMKWLVIIYCLVFQLVGCQPMKVSETKQENKKQLIGKKIEGVKPVSDIVRRIYQDKNGHFWFGTHQEGVIRYDGTDWDQFTTNEGLVGNQVTAFMESKDGALWIATTAGISVFNGYEFQHFTEKNGLSTSNVWSLFQDSKGKIWAGSSEGLCYFDGKSFVQFQLPEPVLENSKFAISKKLVWSMAEDDKGNLWFGTDGNGVFKYDGNKFSQFSTQNGLCNNSITSLAIDSNQHIWMTSMYGGISIFDGNSFKNINQKNQMIGDDEVWTVFKDQSGKIWFSSEGFGVYVWDGKTLHRFGTTEGLLIQAVQSIFQDKAGKLWFGGAGGVYVFHENKFTQVQTNS